MEGFLASSFATTRRCRVRASTGARGRAAALAAMLLAAAGLATLASGCGGIVTGSGVLWEKRSPIPGVTAIVAASGFNVDVVYGSPSEITIGVDKSLRRFLRVRRHGHTLYIGLASGNTYHGTQATVVVTMGVLRRVEATGRTDVTVTGFSGDRRVALAAAGSSAITLYGMRVAAVAAELSGTSSLDGEVRAGTLRLRLTGGSLATLAGATHTMVVDGASASHAFMPDMLADHLRATLDGGSVVMATVLERIDGTLTDGSSLEYLGAPRIGTVTRSGTAQLTAAGR